MAEKARNYAMDNIKFLLISLVIFAHCMECFDNKDGLYRVIYLFHMPAFIFISGYFMKFSPKKILLNYIYPYILFQTLYIGFDAIFIEKSFIRLQYTTPYWIMWYLLVLIFFSIIIPLIDRKRVRSKITVIVISFILMIISGYDTSVGKFLSLARFFNFMPFFIIGYYIGHSEGAKAKILELSADRAVRIFALFLSAIILIYVFYNKSITRFMLFASASYVEADYDPLIKIMITSMAFCVIFTLVLCFKNRKIPIVSTCGKNTLAIFLLHGFVLRIIKKFEVLKYSHNINMVLSFIITIAIILLLGNDFVSGLFKKITAGKWIEKMIKM